MIPNSKVVIIYKKEKVDIFVDSYVNCRKKAEVWLQLMGKGKVFLITKNKSMHKYEVEKRQRISNVNNDNIVLKKVY
jgi:hypothetical protein